MGLSKLGETPAGTVTFVESHVPPLEAGVYRLTITQYVATKDGAVSETPSEAAAFAVAGERFRLDPADLDSVFPASGSQGEYFNVLPHVVIARKTLPWERSARTTPAAGDRTTWLAVLVFDGDDPVPALQSGTVRELVAGGSGGTLPADVVSYPSLTPEYGETLDDPCQFIDVPLALFASVAPSVAELPWLAHARVVALDNKPVDATTDYSTIIAHRFPALGAKSTAHLVSLETMEALLPASDGTASSNIPTTAKTVRLVSLQSWSFDTELPAGARAAQRGFGAILEAVSVGALSFGAALAPSSMPAGQLTLTDADADALVQNAQAMGYTAFDHVPREGGHTVSWYRGPLVPYPVGRRLTTPIDSADAATRYDPNTGMLDVSYAVAWQLGRMMALASRRFSALLVAWKTQQKRETITLAEQQLLAQRIAPQPAATNAPTARAERAAERARLLADPEAIASLRSDPPAIPDEISDWLTRLRRLEGVPFQHRVGDPRMLPAESIRFFHVDESWLDALVDGAFSLGRATSGDLAHDQVHARALRAGDASQPITGLLLRSAAVSGWPGLELNAYATDQTTTLTALRLERLAPGVLFALFDGVASRVDVHEPAEGLHFGVDVADSGTIDPATFTKSLRSLGASTGDPTGTHVPIPYRDAASRVVAIDRLAASMQQALPGNTFTAAELALEMIEGVARVSFVAPASLSTGAAS